MPPTSSPTMYDLCGKCAELLGVPSSSLQVACATCGDICSGMNQPAWQQPHHPSAVASAPKPYWCEDYAPVQPVKWKNIMTPRRIAKEKAAESHNFNAATGAVAAAPSEPQNMRDLTYFSQAAWRASQAWNYQPIPSKILTPPQNTYSVFKASTSDRRPRKRQKKSVPVLTTSVLPAVSAPAASRISLQKHVVLPLVEVNEVTTLPQPIPYQTLDLLVADLRRLLCTPHEAQPFYFRGVFALVADPDVPNTACITRVAWALARGTPLSFNPPALAIQTSAVTHMALTTVQTAAIWMAPLDPGLADAALPSPCSRCEHLLTISAERDNSAAARGLAGQRVIVGLRHFPT
ncbi:hypothetical protein B0H15DRAFT_842005 [Mycena belliarum]|uniref:Uncharacterized protein n=1 Tax=Mycena belliarum TaxID=1033014 RepID=A0AAD6U2E2_9AGAR|nr:hypothetical protein B0H15DRAFT_842005 [Mycena belliae]